MEELLQSFESLSLSVASRKADLEYLEDARVTIGLNCLPSSKKKESRRIFSLDYPIRRALKISKHLTKECL